MEDGYVEKSIDRSKVEGGENWMKLIKDIPTLNFDKEWDVQIIPPFGGAVARFRVFKNGKQIASVYLDFFERLGIYGEPYYELYPYCDDIKRYSLKETVELINDIRELYMETK